MKKCSNCEELVQDKASYCNFCGEKQEINRIENKGEKSKKKGLITGIIIVILVLAGGFGYKYYQEASEENRADEAKSAVAQLFDSKDALNDSSTENDIAKATKMVEKVKDSKLKNKLNDDLIAAANMLDITEDLKAIINEKNILNEEVTIEELESIKENLEKAEMYSPTFYEKYTKIYTIAQQQFDLQADFKKELAAEFNKGQVNEGVTRDTYESLVSKNEAVKNTAVKTTFVNQLNEIKGIIEEREAKEKAEKNTANLTDDELYDRILAYYLNKSEITDDSSKVKFSLSFDSSPTDGSIMYYNPGSLMGMGKGNYTVNETGDFQLTNFSFGEIEHQYDGNIFEEVSQEMIDSIPEFAASSFNGIWTTDNFLIILTEEDVVVGYQNSGNAMFGEITDQSFDPTTMTLSLSVFSPASQLDGIPQDKYLDLEFILKEIDGSTYIEYEGEDYIRNDSYGQ